MQGAVIVYHKHPTSARTQFIRFAHGGVVGREPLPALTCVTDRNVDIDSNCEARLREEIQQLFSLQASEVLVDEEFSAALETPTDLCPVFLLQLKTMDPPLEKVASAGGRFIALTDARGLPDYELQLLREAYKVIMEG